MRALCEEPTTIDHRPGAALRSASMICCTASGAPCRRPPRWRRPFSPRRASPDRCRRRSPNGRPSCLVQRQAHQAEPAGADDHRRLVCERRHFLQRAKRGDARAGQRRRALRRQIADVEQIARMRHDHVVGIAAIAEHAEAAHRAAQIVLAAQAGAARAAADPRVAPACAAPILTPLASGPTATTSPTFSWPSVTGSFMPRSCRLSCLPPPRSNQPSARCRSLWQTPAASTFSSTSRAFRLGVGASLQLQRLAADADLKHAHVDSLPALDFYGTGVREPHSARRVTAAAEGTISHCDMPKI